MKNQSIDQLNLTTEEKQQLKEIVLARINVMPDTLNIAIGGTNVSKHELAAHVEQEDNVGKQMMEMELEFLRDMASGAIYANE